MRSFARIETQTQTFSIVYKPKTITTMITYLSTTKGEEVKFDIDIKDARKGYHSGSCDEDIAKLQKKEYIAKQLNPIPLETLYSILDEYGCEFDDGDDKEEIESIVLWLACGEILEELNEEDE